jgi:hypothetical protein
MNSYVSTPKTLKTLKTNQPPTEFSTRLQVRGLQVPHRETRLERHPGSYPVAREVSFAAVHHSKLSLNPRSQVSRSNDTTRPHRPSARGLLTRVSNRGATWHRINKRRQSLKPRNPTSWATRATTKYEPRAPSRVEKTLGVEPQGSKGLAPCEPDFRETRSLTSITRDGAGALPKTITARRLTTARRPLRHPEVITLPLSLSDRRRGTRVPWNPGLGGLQGATVPSSRRIYPRLLPDHGDSGSKPRTGRVEAPTVRVEWRRRLTNATVHKRQWHQVAYGVHYADRTRHLLQCKPTPPTFIRGYGA